MKSPHARFDRRIDRCPSSIWSLIASIDGLKGQWTAGAKLSPQVLGRLKKSILATSTGASTRIEGARLSDEAVEKLMRGVRMQKFSDRDQQEVRGYYGLLKNVFDHWKNITFNENTIKHFHGELLKYVEKDQKHRGEYKKQENKVHMVDEKGQSLGILFDTTMAYLTPKEMQELVEWTQISLRNKVFHPLLIIGNFIVEFLQIHPFVDGNGRMSRILTNLLLLQTGYVYVPYVSHEKIIEERKTEYYIALRKGQKTLRSPKANITVWLEFFLPAVLEQTQEAIKLLSTENIEQLLSPKQLAVWRFLQTVPEASPKEMAQKLRISRPTINQVTNRLMLLKKIERLGLGSSTRYRLC